MATLILQSYRFLGLECHVLDDGTIAQVGVAGVQRVTKDRRTIVGVYDTLAQALEAAATPAGPGTPGRPRAGWVK